MKVYISGPITGIKDLNRPAFDKAYKMLTQPGIKPISPFNIQCNNKTWTGYMKADIAELVTCDYIYMLHGWWHSKGASVEWLLAKVLKLSIIYA